jgi:hypothetical protein
VLIRIRRGWEIPERLATPEDAYLNRRKFLQGLGISGLGAMGVLAGCNRQVESQPENTKPSLMGLSEPSATVKLYPAKLTKQHGAPLRLATPWKYGYKSIKSIVRVEFLDQQPPTFWSTLVPHEYEFIANVNPAVPHPRWSQASERVLGTEERVPTLPYNGYADFVVSMYKT